jgi:hypothetical protein
MGDAMASGTGWLKRAWAALLPGARLAGRSFAVSCRCGKVLRGQRGTAHQVLRCAGCGRNVFILPTGSFQPPGAPAQPRPIPSALWLLLPILVCGLLAMVVVYGLARGFRPAEPHANPDQQANTPRGQLLALIDRARDEMEQDSLHLGRQHLDEAIRQRDADPTLLTEAEHRRLNQLQRQAALLTDLVPVPVTTLIEQAENARTPAAWQARFRAEYQGRGILLDDVLRADRGGRVSGRRLSDLRIGAIAARVALEDLTLLQQLPLQTPQRWVIGARLRGIDREGGPGWVIRLEPDSGVLFTERVPVEGEVPFLRNDAEWPLLLSRQQAILETLPAPRAHRP